MNGNFYSVQRLTDNIESQDYFPIQKRSISNLSNEIQNDFLPIEKEDIDEYDGILEVPEKKEYTQNQTNYGINGNSFFQFNYKFNNRSNSNTLPNYTSFINSFPSDNILNRPISTDIFQPKKSHDLFPNNNYNIFPLQNSINKRNVSENKFTPIKQTQSKYSSLSENKYHFMDRINLNPKYGFSNFSENNNIKINYAPIDMTKSFNNFNINGTNNTTQNINNSGQKIYSYKNLKNSTMNFYPYETQVKNQNYIYGINNNVQNNNNQRENRFLNYKTNSNYSYNTINYGSFQQNGLFQTMTPMDNFSKTNKIINTNINNGIVSNFNLYDIDTNNNMQTKKSDPILISNNYRNIKFNNLNDNNTINSNSNNNSNFNLNLENQRLTVVSRNPNNKNKNINKNKNKNKSPFVVTKQKKQIKEPEIATVTKISSVHTKILDNNFDNNNNIGNSNINQINKASLNPINNNNIGSEIKQNNKFANVQILNKKITQTNEKINQDKNINNTIQQNSTKTINKTQNELLNKGPNQILNQSANFLANQKLNTNISPSISTIIPTPKINQKLSSNYRTGTHTILTNYNNNQNQLISQNQNNNNKNNNFNNNNNNNNNININININSQPEIPKIIKNDNISKEKVNNGIDVRYNDFDGSGFVKNYGGVTRPGKDIAGKIKINQDAIVCLTNINNIKNFNIFGVLDGHGPDGHFVSEFISDFIPSQLINNPEIKSLSDCEEIYNKFKENNCKIITQAFLDADKQLENVDFNTLESGTTCCLIIHIGKHIMCANTGDSRALVVFDDLVNNNNNSQNLDYLRAVPLSIDYKPDLPEETNRIIMAGGVVEPMTDEFGQGVGPLRVWAKNEDYPGLAMSRSIGDLKAKTLGVIPDPGILEYDLNKSTKFVIVCSDGVWEYFDNDKVKDIGKKFYFENNASAFCHNLVSQAFEEWEKNDKFVDDISTVVAFF